MNINELIEKLEEEWDVDGFLGRVREGVFSVAEGENFLKLLSSIQIPDDALIPKRLLSLLWYIPLFLGWQDSRVAKIQGSTEEYTRFVTEVINLLEDVLGYP